MQGSKILPPTYFVISIGAMLALHFLLPIMTIISFPWVLLGGIPISIGIGFNLVADGMFQRAQTTVKPFEESRILVTDGLFRLSRNPMYVGFAFILAGLGVFLGSLTPFGVVIVFIVLMDRCFICVEEQMLARKFGPAFQAYQQQTRRWL
jgi:protein-S-isoprenylcysteine O-methyltransferase Ste14